MIQLRYCFLADAANHSGDGERVNALGIFNHIYIQELPVLVPSFSLVFCLSGEEEDGEGPFLLDGGLWSPSGERRMALKHEFRVGKNGIGELPGCIYLLPVDRLAVTEEGLHSLRIRWGKDELPEKYQFEMPIPVLLLPETKEAVPSKDNL